jgi:alpha-glucoside transport system permease protein
MQTVSEIEQPSIGRTIGTFIGRILLTILIPTLAFIILWQGFIFLRDSDAPKWMIAIVAVLWGVGGVAMLYFTANWLIERLPKDWYRRLIPFVFVGPAIAILFWALGLPALRTLYASLHGPDGSQFVGLQNYATVFTNPDMLVTFRNNLLWMVFGTIGCVVFGLLIAVLADKSRFETLGKALIFLPLAISFVGAGVIWNFVYVVRDAADPQIGLLNAIVVGLGGQPQAWTAFNQPWNNFFLIAIMVWLQTGYCMVLFSASIKGIDTEILEAARMDGCNERQVFFKITLPMILPTIIVVSTTVVIFALKIFDVVIVMTGGQFGTDVIATQFYRQYFTSRNFGLASALAMLLLIAVIPVMIYNLKQFNEREAF